MTSNIMLGFGIYFSATELIGKFLCIVWRRRDGKNPSPMTSPSKVIVNRYIVVNILQTLFFIVVFILLVYSFVVLFLLCFALVHIAAFRDVFVSNFILQQFGTDGPWLRINM